MSVQRSGDPRALTANPDGDKRGPRGRVLCKWCGTETKPPRRVWCSDACTQEFLVRTDQSYARHAVWRRDKGRCALCQFDCTALKRQLRALRKRHGFERFAKVVRVLGIAHYRSGTLWHADHVKPVVEGGGMCGLENLRTLCRWCHAGETRKLMRRLRDARRLAAADTQNKRGTDRTAAACRTSHSSRSASRASVDSGASERVRKQQVGHPCACGIYDKGTRRCACDCPRCRRSCGADRLPAPRTGTPQARGTSVGRAIVSSSPTPRRPSKKD